MANIKTVDGEITIVKETVRKIDYAIDMCCANDYIPLNRLVSVAGRTMRDKEAKEYKPIRFIVSNIIMYY